MTVAGDVVLMEWTASSDRGRVDDGVDTLVLGGDGIRAQTVHYTPPRGRAQ